MERTQERFTDRRSGQDRRLEADGDRAHDTTANDGAGQPTIARWPLVMGAGFEDAHPSDPWVSVVHRSIADYAAGRCDSARQAWDERIVWRVDGGASAAGPDGVFGHHRRLDALTGGTFRQALVSLEGCGGPIVEAHVRTTAARNMRTLDIPTLIVFELAAMRIRLVTEIPGDRAAWDDFWGD